MKKTTLIALIAITLVVAVAAVVSVRMQEAATRSTIEARDLFPKLKERINDVAEVDVVTPQDRFTVVRQGEAWGLRQKEGFPAKFETVRALAMQMSELESLEPKTQKPDLHDRLGLLDPESAEDETEEGVGTKVVLRDEQGDELASLILGNRKATQEFVSNADQLYYVRRGGEDQTWLAQGRVDVPGYLTRWVNNELLRVQTQRVKSVRVEHPDGETVVAVKPEIESVNFELEDIPEGKELRSRAIASTLATPIAWLNLEDMVKAEKVDFDSEEKTVSTFRTFDGLVVTLTQAPHESDTYVKVGVALDEEQMQEAAEYLAQKEAEEDESESPAPIRTEPEIKTPEEVREEAEAIRARVEGWAFKIPQGTARNMSKRMADLVKDEEPVQAEEGMPAPMGLPPSAAAGEPAAPMTVGPDGETQLEVVDVKVTPVELPDAESPAGTPAETPEETDPAEAASEGVDSEKGEDVTDTEEGAAAEDSESETPVEKAAAEVPAVEEMEEMTGASEAEAPAQEDESSSSEAEEEKTD